MTIKSKPSLSFRNVDPEFTGDHRVELITASNKTEAIAPLNGETLEFLETPDGVGFCLSNDMCALSAGQLKIDLNISNLLDNSNLTVINKRRQIDLLDLPFSSETDVGLIHTSLVEAFRNAGLSVGFVGNETPEIYLANYTSANITLEIKIDVDTESTSIEQMFGFTGDVVIDTKLISGNTYSIRFCLTPHPDVKLKTPPEGLSAHVNITMTGVFDVFVDDMHVPDSIALTMDEIIAKYNPQHPKITISAMVAADNAVVAPTNLEIEVTSASVPSNVCIVSPSAWSNDVTFDMVNLPNSSGYIGMSMGYGGGGYWNGGVLLEGKTTALEVLIALRDDGCPIEVREGSVPGTAQIRYLPEFGDVGSYEGWTQSEVVFAQCPTGVLVDQRDNPYYQGTLAETQSYMSNYFTDPPVVKYCTDPNVPEES